MAAGGPLAHRNFRLLLCSDGASMLGSAMAAVALPFAVLETGGTAADVGYVSAAVLGATVASLLFGGVVADRIPRLRVMVVTEVVQGLAQAAFAIYLLVGGSSTLWMVVLAAVRGAAFGGYLPAAQGLVPLTVPPDELAPANAYRRLVANSTQIGGALIGGVAVALVGAGWTLAVDAATFAVAALVRTGMRLQNPSGEQVATGYIRDLKDGWREFTRHSWLWSIVIQFAVINAVFLGCFSVLGPIVAEQSLNGARSWGTVVAAQAVGAAVGAGVILRFRPRRPLVVGMIGSACMAFPLLAMSSPSSLFVIAAAAGLAGIGIEVFGVSWSTTVQEQIPPDRLSRVIAYDAVGSYALSPIGPLAVAPVTALIGVGATLVAGGTLIALTSLGMLLLPSIRSVTSRTSRDRTARKARNGPPTEIE